MSYLLEYGLPLLMSWRGEPAPSLPLPAAAAAPLLLFPLKNLLVLGGSMGEVAALGGPDRGSWNDGRVPRLRLLSDRDERAIKASSLLLQ